MSEGQAGRKGDSEAGSGVLIIIIIINAEIKVTLSQ